MGVGSLAYRRNESEIVKGHVPEKYLRLLPYITGQRILEIGAAEGVQSLLVADRNPSAHVTALELHQERHAQALALQARWRLLGRHVDGCHMVCGDIRDRLDLLEGVDTVVAIRTIYHLGDAIDDVLAAVFGAGVANVVLVGNPNRAKWPNSTPKARDIGAFNRYAGVPGMRDVLERAGFTVGTVVAEGDPIVTGHR